MDDSDFDSQYFETLSRYGKEVFSEFLSDLSRKRQVNTVISSLITILFAYAIIEPKETEFAGIKFTFTDVNLIPIVTGAICLYFLVTYLIGVLQDWHHTNYRTMPARINSLTLSHRLEQALLQHMKDGSQLSKDLADQLPKVMEDEGKKFDQLSEMRKRHQSEKDSLKRQGASMAELIVLEKQHLDEKDELTDSLFETSDEKNQFQVLIKQAKQHVGDNSLHNKADLLYKTGQRYLVLRNLNVLIEIIFPALLALFAIGSVIWKITH